MVEEKERETIENIRNQASKRKIEVSEKIKDETITKDNDMECLHLSSVTSIENTELLICNSCGVTIPSKLILFQILKGLRAGEE